MEASAGDAGRWLSTKGPGHLLVPDSVSFVGPVGYLADSSSTPEGPTLCEAGFPTRSTRPEHLLGRLEGGGTTASTTTSSGRVLVRLGTFGTILKE